MRFSKSTLLLIALILSNCLYLFAQQDSLDFPAPQFILPFYDGYSQNHLNVEAMGRGFTTSVKSGRVESSIANPAALGRYKSNLYFEVAIKPPIKDLNKDSESLLASPIPFGVFGFSGKLYRGINGAISYNVPKSIVYDDFTVEIGQGASAQTWYPSYTMHQLTTTFSGNLGNFNLGLNLHQQLHQFKDIIVLQTFDRIDKTVYALRAQPGIVYIRGKSRFGATFTPVTIVNMDVRNADYDVTLPMKVSVGFSTEYRSYTLLMDVDWEQFSSMDSKFDDRTTIKAGFEKNKRNTTYRLGLMHMSGVYEGAYRLPIKQTTDPAILYNWGNIPRGGIIGDTDQMYVTLGFTYHFKGGSFSMGAMRDVLGHVPSTHLSSSLGFNLDTLKGKRFIIFDK